MERLLAEEHPFMFLTNNSQRSRRDIQLRLKHMGITIEERHVFTCAIRTARFLARQKRSRGACRFRLVRWAQFGSRLVAISRAPSLTNDGFFEHLHAECLAFSLMIT